MDDKGSTREEKNGENRKIETKKEDRKLQSKNQRKAETKKLQSSSSNGGQGSSSEADGPILLLKFPPSVAEALASPSATSAGAPVAKIVLTIDPLKPQPSADAEGIYSFVVGEHGGAHHTYSLQPSNNPNVGLVAFSETQSGGASIVGAVTSRMRMERSNDERLNHWRKRKEKANVRPRKTKLIQFDNKEKSVARDSMIIRVDKGKKSVASDSMGSNRVLEVDKESSESMGEEEEQDLVKMIDRELETHSDDG